MYFQTCVKRLHSYQCNSIGSHVLSSVVVVRLSDSCCLTSNRLLFRLARLQIPTVPSRFSVNNIRADRHRCLLGTSSRFLSSYAKFVSVATLDTSTSHALTRSCTYKYSTFTCRVRLDKPCPCANARAPPWRPHRRFILARMPRSFRLAFTHNPSAHPAPSAYNSLAPLL